MEETRRPRVKVCCIGSPEEAWMAIRAGASALGLVSAMPSGPGVITEDAIARIASAVPPTVSTFLLTSLQDATAIAEQQRRLRTTTLQICDRIERGSLLDLRGALPGIGLVQVIHVTGEGSLQEAVAIAPSVDALLLDSGNPSLAVKELGGTGRRHDWRISRQIREAVPIPIFLAGGLNSLNVAEAIAEVGPFGLDLCSSVREGGRLDPRKLDLFFSAVRSASAE